jgi:3-phenylpropionate/trans-cinnamate dioxygenase ferredoxin reductase subunit
MAERHVDYLLIGGGLACASAAGRLRELDSDASITLVGREPDPPYHRPPCSKSFLEGKEGRADTYVQQREWYEERGIELLTRTSVSALDASAKIATLANRKQLSFGKALLATGANVHRLPVAGDALEGIHYLRTLGNAEAIRSELEQVERVVMIGGSYIGCEVAASLSAIGKRCAIVMLEEVPFERAFGARVGAYFAELLRAHDIELHPGEELAGFDGTGRVELVRTASGREIAAELVVIGAGVAPEVQLARSAGLMLGERGGVRCNSNLQSSAPEIFVAGDICEYDSILHGAPIRIEHWDVAHNQGLVAAENMAGQPREYDVLPYFFSDLSDWASLEYVGPAYAWDEEITRGEMASGSFSQWYLHEGRVVAALSLQRSEELEVARSLIAQRRVLSAVERSALGDSGAELSALGARG